MTRRLVVMVALSSLVAMGSQPPRSGGRVTVLIPDSDEGIAIAATLGDRAAETYLTRPDGADSRLSLDPSLREPTFARRSWTLIFPDAASPNAVDVAGNLAALLDGEGGPAPFPAAWPDLTSARALDERRLVLAFDDAVCAPLARFARWPIRPAARGSFRLTSGSGDFSRNDRALFAPRLDRLEIVLAEAPLDRPRRSELTVLPGRAADAADRSPSLEPGGLGEDDIAIVYSIELDTSVPETQRRWLAIVLSPSAFEPLVAPHEAIALPACAGQIGDPGEVMPVTAGHVTVEAPEGVRSELLKRRVDIVLAERFGQASAPPASSGNGAGHPIAIRIRRDVVLDAGPIGLADACVSRVRATRWPIVAVAYHVDRGSAVIGPIGSPDRLWLAR